MNQPVVFITGTSTGFGYLASIALAKNGYHVIASMRDLDKSQKLRDLAEQEKLQIEIVQLDVAKIDEIQSIITGIIDRVGQIDVLINNAGYAEGGFVEDVTMDQYYRQFETNFFGLVAVTKAVLPSMRERRSGKIINISSISGRVGFPALSPYVASKHAVEGFSESLRLELLSYGVYVTLIEPGSYKTEVWSKGFDQADNFKDSPYVEHLDRILEEVEQIGKLAEDPQDVVDLIVKVVNTERPKLRYLIGQGVKRNVLLKSILPWEWLERKIIQHFR